MSLVPPSARDGWSYSGEFHVDASGNNRHRRATVPELKAIFDGTDGSKDRTAHWYEAQLIHYGLPPSKTKGTAKMRLFDAVSKDSLAVPAHILKIEAELKKDWNKREREAKQALKKLSASVPTTSVKGSNKRKADDGHAGVWPESNVNINLSLSIGCQGNAQVSPARPMAKKPKSSPAKKPIPTTSASVPSARTAPRSKQTARRGSSRARGSKPVSSHLTAAAPDDNPASRNVQTARRSRPFNRAGQARPGVAIPQPLRADATPSQWDLPKGPPQPYPGSSAPMGDDYDDDYDGDYDGDYDDHDFHPSGLPPLGLLNGRYRLRCTAPHEYADGGEDSDLIFTLDGDTLWGSFEIGPLSGILRLDGRPWSSSYQPLYVQWRGEDDQGLGHSETDDGSYVKFLGDGIIQGGNRLLRLDARV